MSSENCCGGCHCNRIKATSYVVTPTALNILDSFVEPKVASGKRYELILCANLPSMTTIVPVFVKFNGNLIPLLDHIGNKLMSDQLRVRKCYPLIYGANPAHLIVSTCVPPSNFQPVIALNKSEVDVPSKPDATEKK